MVLTGSYFSHSHVIDMQKRINTTIEVKYMDKRGKHAGIPRVYKGRRLIGSLSVPMPVNTQASDVNKQVNQRVAGWEAAKMSMNSV
mgnify:CR=1 FL=1